MVKLKASVAIMDGGTRGNTNFFIFEAASMKEAKKKVFESDEYEEDEEYEPEPSIFADLKRDSSEWKGISLTIYAISQEFEFDLKALQAKDREETLVYIEKNQREADERELTRLQKKLKK